MRKLYLLLPACILLSCIQIMAQPTAGLVAYWPLNGNFNDAGPNAINGTNYSATATTNVANVANTAMAFANPTATVAQYGTHPSNSNLNFVAQDFSISLSFLVNSPYVHANGFYDNNLNSGGYGLWLWTNPDLRVNFNWRNGNVNYGPLALGTWIRVCAVRASGTVKLYVNGTLVSSAAEGTSGTNYGYPARFGTMFYFAQVPPEYNGQNGKLDDIRIYNRALSDAEVLQIATLPVKLSSFTGNRNNENILLKWRTHHEENSRHFNVQRSTDGSSFETIATVTTTGNVSTGADYSYNDKLTPTLNNTPVLYYRLEQVDKDGSKEYSTIVAIKNGGGKELLNLLGNPVKNELRLSLYTAKTTPASITVTDIMGRAAFVQTPSLMQGNNFTTLNTASLSPGVYIVTVIIDGEKTSRQFIKE